MLLRVSHDIVGKGVNIFFSEIDEKVHFLLLNETRSFSV